MRTPFPGARGLMALLWAMAMALGGAGPALADQQDRRLEDLFARLQTTTSRAEAQVAQQQIWQIWIEADDSLANRLMRNGIEAMAARRNSLALQYFDQLVEEAPDFAEGWNKRATVHYLMDDYAASVLDIERTRQRIEALRRQLRGSQT